MTEQIFEVSTHLMSDLSDCQMRTTPHPQQHSGLKLTQAKPTVWTQCPLLKKNMKMSPLFYVYEVK